MHSTAVMRTSFVSKFSLAGEPSRESLSPCTPVVTLAVHSSPDLDNTLLDQQDRPQNDRGFIEPTTFQSPAGQDDPMSISLETPGPDQLVELAEELARWQQIPWTGQLHPGDLGWHSSVGADRSARDLRVWRNGARVVALGMLDGPGLIRLAIAPDCTADTSLAEAMAHDLENPAGLLPEGPVNVIEARGATALQSELRRRGWAEDEEWTPLVLELTDEPRWERLETSGLRIESVGAEGAAEWTAAHWSSFKGTPYTHEAQAGFVRRWSTLMTGPLAPRAQSLIGYDPAGAAVAVTTVWNAGEGRPGLVEPMGVHRDHQGKGYGVAITQAAAMALHQAGASAAAVVAENSNPAALATYTAAGFTAAPSVCDLARPQSS